MMERKSHNKFNRLVHNDFLAKANFRITFGERNLAGIIVRHKLLQERTERTRLDAGRYGCNTSVHRYYY